MRGERERERGGKLRKRVSGTLNAMGLLSNFKGGEVDYFWFL